MYTLTRAVLIVRFKGRRDRVAQWVACLTRNVSVVSSSPLKGPHCFLEQETLLLLLFGSMYGLELDFTIELN